jgi:cytoskeletal protein CcmA (bactofilin family)
MNKNGLTGKHTLIEEGTEFRGSLSSTCPIVVVGKIEGNVTGPVIHIAASGVVAGRVSVQQLRSEGELAGEVDAEVVQIAGTVRDGTRIRAKTLQVTLATKNGMEVVFGECELAIGDEPNKQAAIDAATAAPQEPTASLPVVEAGEPADSGKPTEGIARPRGRTHQPPS